MKNRFAVVVWWLGVLAAVLGVATSLFLMISETLSNNEIVKVALLGVAGLAVGAVLFAICFVIGGTFWTPPRISHPDIESSPDL